MASFVIEGGSAIIVNTHAPTFTRAPCTTQCCAADLLDSVPQCRRLTRRRHSMHCPEIG